MQLPRGRWIFALVLPLLLGLSAKPACAQWHVQPAAWQLKATQKPAMRPVPRNNFQPNRNPGAVGNGQPNVRGMAALPPKWVENLRDMSPEEQQRFMQNNERFQSLPAQRQAQIRQNLENWNRLSPTERNALRDRARILEQMSPQQRVYLQRVLLPEWQQLPPQRRQLINGRLHTLQGMSPADRQAALGDPQFMRGLSPEEQSMVRDLNSLRNPASP